MRCRYMLQNPRIKISVENDHRAPVDMVLQVLRNIGPGRRTDQFIVTDTVYCSRSRIDADSRFLAGLKKISSHPGHSPDPVPARWHQA